MRHLQRLRWRFPLRQPRQLQTRQPKLSNTYSKNIRVGDIVFAHSNGIMGRAIRFGETLRWKRGSEFNHVAIVSEIRKGVPYVIQAEPRGITNDKPITSVGLFITRRPPRGVDPKKVVAFARAQVGLKYGWLSIVSVFFDILTPNWFPSFRRDNTWICSALAAESLRFGGWLHSWADIYVVTPAQLWDVYRSVTTSSD